LFKQGWWANVTPEDLKDAEKVYTIKNHEDELFTAMDKLHEMYESRIFKMEMYQRN